MSGADLTPELLNGFSDDNLDYEIFSFILQRKIGNNYEQVFEIVKGLASTSSARRRRPG
jgi:hypothetical protein